MVECLVCREPAESCPSPFSPGSYPRCKECLTNHRVWYLDLLVAATGNKILGEEYFEKYKKPTLEFFSISETEFQQDVEIARKELEE